MYYEYSPGPCSSRREEGLNSTGYSPNGKIRASSRRLRRGLGRSAKKSKKNQKNSCASPGHGIISSHVLCEIDQVAKRSRDHRLKKLADNMGPRRGPADEKKSKIVFDSRRDQYKLIAI